MIFKFKGAETVAGCLQAVRETLTYATDTQQTVRLDIENRFDFSRKLSHNTVLPNIVQIDLIRGGKDGPYPNRKNS